MNFFLNDCSIHEFIDTNSNSTFGDVEDDPSSSMVELVGHTFVLSWICKNIYIIPNFIVYHICRQLRNSICPEALCEHITCACPISIGVRHLVFFFALSQLTMG
mmetsp:Transcript_32539/g.41717  ORF Transcript_32539/g.41717 Transcript_32539/m.41717 type:complete len:104 (-) Transcript_32539:53-364(-)